jgi:hypothetical protein
MTSTRPRGPTNLEASQPVMLTTMEPNSAGQKPAMLNPLRSKATDPSIPALLTQMKPVDASAHD